jgi:two-component system, NarL family, response regulator LiaR
MTRTIVVDDHDLFRRGVARLLREAGVDVVGEASNGPTAVQISTDLRPDVVLMDVAMPGMSGIEATRQILETAPETRVVMLTSTEGDHLVLDAILAGATGYVLKEASLQQIVDAVEAAAVGQAVISPRVAPELLRHLRASNRPHVPRPDAPDLTGRELQVLQLLAEGRENATIAQELVISLSTVKSHVASILGKLGVENRLEAAVFALRQGIVS